MVVDTSDDLKRMDLKELGELDHSLVSGMTYTMIAMRQVIIGYAKLVIELTVLRKFVLLLGVIQVAIEGFQGCGALCFRVCRTVYVARRGGQLRISILCLHSSKF